MVKLILTINGEELDYDIIKEGATFGEQISLLPFDTEIKKLIRKLGGKENINIPEKNCDNCIYGGMPDSDKCCSCMSDKDNLPYFKPIAKKEEANHE